MGLPSDCAAWSTCPGAGGTGTSVRSPDVCAQPTVVKAGVPRTGTAKSAIRSCGRLDMMVDLHQMMLLVEDDRRGRAGGSAERLKGCQRRDVWDIDRNRYRLARLRARHRP